MAADCNKATNENWVSFAFLLPFLPLPFDSSHLGLGGLLPLLSLSLGDGSLSGGGPDLGLLGPLGEDGSKIGTDDSSGVLGGLSRTLLGDLLGNTLLVHSSVDLKSERVND